MDIWEGIRVYVEDEKLKIYIGEYTNDRYRRQFMGFLFWCNAKVDPKDKRVLFVKRFDVLERFDRSWRNIINGAKIRGIEVTEECEQFLKNYETEERLQWQKELEEKRRQEIIQAAKNRQQDGCMLCEHLRWSEGRHLCTYAARYCLYKPHDIENEVEARIEAKVLRQPVGFIAQAYPCEGCEYIKKAQEVLEIMKLEEQENGKHGTL